VLRTRVGYAGGTSPSPTYRTLGDHTETLQIDFDPQLISYQELLDVFWEAHEPAAPAYSRQYRSLILVHDALQQQIAEKSKADHEKMAGMKFETSIEPLQVFTLAENYHQKYYLRQRSSLMHDLQIAYSDEPAFIHATLSARLNAVAGGYTSEALLEELTASPLLSEKTKLRLTGNK
jgi:peptide-methionine (S)-S-oxide reductase